MMSGELLLAALGVAAMIAIASRRRGGSTGTRVPRPPAIGSLEGDRETLRALRDAGADLRRPTEVNFYLYFPTRESAEAAARQSETSQLAAEVQPGAGGKGWLCLLTGDLIPTENNIREASVRLQGVAAANGGEYDGWEARVSP